MTHPTLSLGTTSGSEGLRASSSASPDAQQQAHELIGADVATSIKQRVDAMFAEHLATRQPRGEGSTVDVCSDLGSWLYY
jgi:hypothetical protein